MTALVIIAAWLLLNIAIAVWLTKRARARR